MKVIEVIITYNTGNNLLSFLKPIINEYGFDFKEVQITKPVFPYIE